MEQPDLNAPRAALACTGQAAAGMGQPLISFLRFLLHTLGRPLFLPIWENVTKGSGLAPGHSEAPRRSRSLCSGSLASHPPFSAPLSHSHSLSSGSDSLGRTGSAIPCAQEPPKRKPLAPESPLLRDKRKRNRHSIFGPAVGPEQNSPFPGKFLPWLRRAGSH